MELLRIARLLLCAPVPTVDIEVPPTKIPKNEETVLLPPITFRFFSVLFSAPAPVPRLATQITAVLVAVLLF